MSKASVSKKGQEVETNASVAPATLPVTPAFEYTPLGLKRLRKVTADDFAEVLNRIHETHEQHAWNLGDVMMFAIDDNNGENTLKEIAEKYGWSAGTLRNKKRIAEAIPMSFRTEFTLRSDELKYNHYVEVAIYPTEEKKRDWLQKAIDNQWSARELGRQIKKSKKQPGEVQKMNSATVLKQIERLTKIVVSEWGQWEIKARSEIATGFFKLTGLITKDAAGNLTVKSPAVMPSAENVAAAVKATEAAGALVTPVTQ